MMKPYCDKILQGWLSSTDSVGKAMGSLVRIIAERAPGNPDYRSKMVAHAMWSQLSADEESLFGSLYSETNLIDSLAFMLYSVDLGGLGF